MEEQWTRYLSKSGETLFIYNKTTGEHRWPAQYNSNSMENNIQNGQRILCKELFNVATQTDDTGCINGCTSVHANAGCISSRASMVEIRMDDLEMSEQCINHKSSVGHSAVDVVNASPFDMRDAQIRYLLPKPIARSHVSVGPDDVIPMEVDVDGTATVDVDDITRVEVDCTARVEVDVTARNNHVDTVNNAMVIPDTNGNTTEAPVTTTARDNQVNTVNNDIVIPYTNGNTTKVPVTTTARNNHVNTVNNAMFIPVTNGNTTKVPVTTTARDDHVNTVNNAMVIPTMNRNTTKVPVTTTARNDHVDTINNVIVIPHTNGNPTKVPVTTTARNEQHVQTVNGVTDNTTSIPEANNQSEQTQASVISTVNHTPRNVAANITADSNAIKDQVNSNGTNEKEKSNAHGITVSHVVPISASPSSTKPPVAPSVNTTSAANNVAIHLIPKAITSAVALPPANKGYISGALYLGNGKFVNVLVPANSVNKGSNGIAPVINPSGLSQIVGSSSVARGKVNGIITNVEQAAKVVNSNLTNIVHPQFSNVIPSSTNAGKTVVNVVYKQKTNTSNPTTKSVDSNTQQQNGTLPPSLSYLDQSSKQPKQFVIANVFSYATNEVINHANQEGAMDPNSKGIQADMDVSSGQTRIESAGETHNGLTVVKIEPTDSNSNIIKEVHKCTYCYKTFAQNSDMLMHQKTHSGERRFKCPHCEKEFRHNSSLKVHIKLHTGEKPYKCCSCDRTFRQKVHLRNHLRTHTEDNRFKCNYCEKSYRHKCDLIGHLVTHTDRLPFKCESCDRAFAQKCHLDSHVQAHCKSNQDICPYCKKEFRFGSSLNLHLRTHTGEKPFKCSLCDMTFRQKQHLIVHVRRHTGEKPFKCEICTKAFRHDTALRSHLLIHPESKYSKAQTAMFTKEQIWGTDESTTNICSSNNISTNT